MPAAPLRILIAGGGTGGHLYPGIAVAREVIERRPDAQVSFAGTARGIEAKVLPREGFELDILRSSGLKGKSLSDRLRGLWLLPIGLVDASTILAIRRPHVVIGVGGYSSGPVVLMAALRGIPTMLLEQNAVPGLTNRLLSWVVRAAAVTYDSTCRYFGHKAFVSGNPVRPEFLDADEVRATGGAPHGHRLTVLVFGGSQGAHGINLAMSDAAPLLADPPDEFSLVHQTGERDVELVRAAYQRAGLRAEVEPFLYDMGQRLRAADLVVCRAGATTLAELAATGRPAVLIPLPTATDDHQRKNAETWAHAGAAEVLVQSEASGARLASVVRMLAGDPGRRARMSSAAKAFARADAAKVIVDRVLALAG
jgi:UDP-N-acetylglucosamine--N-acetylmuramyl-(pentapeptide) pyrophosphoryl-undecaprenol N-acetylglucosamine transferase